LTGGGDDGANDGCAVVSAVDVHETSGLWVAYVRLEDPPGLSPITTIGRYATVEAAQLATDEVWAAR
jgi:hypothetical protein